MDDYGVHKKIWNKNFIEGITQRIQLNASRFISWNWWINTAFTADVKQELY